MRNEDIFIDAKAWCQLKKMVEDLQEKAWDENQHSAYSTILDEMNEIEFDYKLCGICSNLIKDCKCVEWNRR